jgi:N-acetylglutamate synthase-like GNAT family acetyltransferase
MKIKRVAFSSKEYDLLLSFRFINLRKPLSLTWTQADLSREGEQIHIAYFNQNNIIGSCVLKKINTSTIRLRQMAIDKNYQRIGLGTKLLDYAEKYAKKNNYKEIVIIARISAFDFYQINGYEPLGEELIDVTVRSIKMKKILITNE